ncbi:MAG: hypothetical protein ACKOBM_18105 [Gammaproteobacteria bacterium]
MMHGATDHANQVGAELTPDALLGNIARMLLLTPFEARMASLADLPAPARQLLDHACGMTQTLEAHWGEAMQLHTHAQRLTEDRLYRLVALRGADSGRVYEIAAIRIWLARLPAVMRDAVRAGQHPLGRLLADADIAFESRAIAFLHAQCPASFAQALGIDPTRALPGRISRLYADNNPIALCETVELLPEA